MVEVSVRDTGIGMAREDMKALFKAVSRLRAKGMPIEEGVELAINEKPDLIIMDIQLPGMDGLEAAKRIRESEADGKAPIIAVTSYAMAGDRDRIIKGGCTGYIEKPIDPETFLSEIEKHLSSGG